VPELPPVLCYHRIGGPLELGVTRVSERAFRRQMGGLARAGWRTLRLKEFLHGFEQQSTEPKTFLLTFDDGYASLAETAYPVLSELGFTATTFLVTDYVGKANTWDVRYTWARLTHLDWPAIEAWQARGFDFGSHGATHRRLTWMSGETIQDELRRSRSVLVDRLGADAGLAVAYPFGAADRRVTTCAEVYRYSAGFAGPRGDASDRFNLPRTPVYLWDRWAVPFGLRDDALGTVGRSVATVANAAAVGTSLLKALVPRRQRAAD
jgi:peptidoglycan/xylan/chitin deacetylase (PgdA/CDA1 family)